MDKPDVSELSDIFFEAAETERKLPAAIRKQKMSSWPDYVHSWSAYGYGDFKPGLPKATPTQIDSYEMALVLGIEMMDEDDRKIVWAVAHSAAFRERGPQWYKLAKMRGYSDGRVIKRKYQDALIRCWYKIQAQSDDILAEYF